VTPQPGIKESQAPGPWLWKGLWAAGVSLGFVSNLSWMDTFVKWITRKKRNLKRHMSTNSNFSPKIVSIRVKHRT
jgi:hypothetical protein